MSLIRLNDYDVPGYGMTIGANFEFQKTDASGDSSSTAKASKGTKGKAFSVRLYLRFSQTEELQELIRVAQAKDNGTGRIYTIANDTASAMGVRQVTFSDRFSVDEQDGLKHWLISFTLTEYNSVPEAVEGREILPQEETQIPPGQTVEEEEQLTPFEQKLKELDGSLGGGE